MKKFILSICLLFMMSASSDAQEMKFRAVKPLSIVKNTVCYTAQLTGKVLCGAKKIVMAPFTTPVPLLEVKRNKYTFPKVQWRRGKLEEIPEVDSAVPAPQERSELLDLPRVQPLTTLI